MLRIEDTDVARSTQDSVDQILASMRWLGLNFDEGPIYQMQRLDRYQTVVDQMILTLTENIQGVHVVKGFAREGLRSWRSHIAVYCVMT